MTSFYDTLLEQDKAQPPAQPAAPSFYDSLKAQDEEEGRLRASVSIASQTSPDKAANQQYLSKVTGLPLPVVQTNEGEAQARAKFQEISELAKTSPVLKARLMDPNFTAVAQNDTPVLSAIEQGLRNFFDGQKPQTKADGTQVLNSDEYSKRVRDFKDRYNVDWDTARSMAGQGMILNNSTERIGGWDKPEMTLGNWINGKMVGFVQGLEQMRQGINRQFGDAIGSEGMSERARIANLRSQNQVELNRPQFESSTAQGLDSGVDSLLQNAPGLVASVLTGNPIPALGMIGTQSEAQAYSKYRDRGASGGMALLGGVGEGSMEVATELLPMKVVVDKLGKVGFGHFMKEFLGKEMVGEQLNTAVNDAIDTAIANPDKTWSQYLAERPGAAYQTALATLVQSGVLAGTSHVLSKTTMAKQASDFQIAQAIVADQKLQQAFALAAQSDLRAKAPQTFAEVAQEMAEKTEGAPTEVRFDARTLGEVLNQEELAKLPSIASQLQEAIATGGEVSVPLGELMANVAGTPLEQKLTEHARVGDAELSSFEAKEAQAQAESYLQEEAKRVIENASDSVGVQMSADKVKQAMLDQFTKLGRFTPDVNGAYATIAADMYVALGSRLGMTPEQAYAAHPLTLTGVNPATQGEVLNASKEVKESEALRGIVSHHTLAEVQAELAKYKKGEAAAPLSPQDAKIAEGHLTPMLERAAAAKPQFDATVSEVASSLGGEAKIPGLKGLERASEKLMRETDDGTGKPDPSQIRDLLRATVVVQDVADVQKAIAALKEKFDVVRVKDRYANPLESGYRDILMNVRLPDGTMAEVQVNVPAMMTAKDSGHKLYEMSRAMPEGEEKSRLEDLQSRLYGEAFDFAQNSKSDASALEALARKTSAGNGLDGDAANTTDPSANLSTGTESTSNSSAPSGTSNGSDITNSSNGSIVADANEGYQQAPQSDIGHKREKATGRYVGAPDWVGGSPQQLTKLRKKLRQLASEGESGRFWYERSSKAVLDLVGGDKVDAEKFVGLLAIYSQGTEVNINLGFALEAYYQWKAGLPIDTGRFPTEQTKKANAWLNEGKDWGGIKTNNFYADLMEEIDPSKFDEGHATMDMWMALAFDYGMKVLDQGPKYGFAKRETARLAQELGWKPHQVQAAIWTAIKARVETSAKERNARELAEGIAVKNGNAHAIVKGREYEHFRMAHKVGMEAAITKEQIASRGVDFADALESRSVQMSWEATPSVTGGDIPGIHTAPTAQKMEYLEAIAKALTPEGRDLIAEAINLHNPPTIFGFSAWEGAVGAGAQSFFPVPITGQGKDRAVLHVARDMLGLYAAIKGMVLKQDAVVWHTPVWDGAKASHNGLHINTARPLTEAEVQQLYVALQQRFNTWELAPGWRPDGVRVLNFVDGLDNKEFQKGADEVIASLPEGFGGEILSHAGFRSDGDYIGNNWEQNPNGEEYTNRIASQRPDILGRVAELRARVEAVNNEFAKRYGWERGSTEPNGSFFQSPNPGVRTGTTQDEAGPRPGSVDVTGVHFSKQTRVTLDGRYYGTGLKGIERERIYNSPDQRLRDRVYFYINEGKGVRPEAGVGGAAHSIELSNLYDINEDPLKLIVGGDLNATESNVLNAGFNGYYRRDAFNQQGAAVVIGPASHGMVATAIPNPTTKAPPLPVSPQTYKRGLTSKELNALDIGMVQQAAPTARVRAGTFQVEERELQAAQAAMSAQGIELPMPTVYAQPTGKSTARGTMNPKTMTISLLEGADLSTFHHEMAHFYLEVLAHIASQENAPVAIVNDMMTLLKWFGVADLQTWNKMSLEEKRASHEMFAEHYEQYLFEGKSPNLEMQTLFRRFASWMKNVYKSLQAFMLSHNSNLTEDVRGVYDRMLATEAQIQEAESARKFAPLFKSAEEVGMNPAEWAQYQLAAQNATEDAIENLQARSLRDLKWTVNAKNKAVKAMQKAVDGKVKEVRAEVTDEVNAMPVYAAKSYLDSLKGDRTDADLQLASELFGFDSVDQMLREMTEAQPIKHMIEGMTDQRLLERYGDLTTPKGIEDAANEAVHNEARARFVATELKALSEGMRLKTTDRSSILEKLKECIGS